MAVLAALADPVRLEIVELLAAGEAGAGEIAARFPVSRPAISRHLRVLREAGLVRSAVHGQQRVYALERVPLRELARRLDALAAEPARPAQPVPPSRRLDALDTELRRGQRDRRRDPHHDSGTRPEGETDERTAG